MTINFKALSEIDNKIKFFHNSELLIVTHNQSFDDILTLVQNNYNLFGENRVQEAQKKFENINNSEVQLHLIGPLQSNKVKVALNIFNTIQTIDRKSLVDEIAKQKKKTESIKTNEFFIQVNIGAEKQKSGVAKDKTKELYEYALNSGLNITGLMCIPPNDKDCKIYFNEMYKVKELIKSNLKLSMGMSGDYITALECKSNMIRIGSLIFKNV